MWNGFDTKKFTFKDRNATIIFPKGVANGKILLKTEYLDAFPGFDIAMLERGYHLIHIGNFSGWAPDEEIEIMAVFIKCCAEELKLSEKCVIEGISLGGLQATRLAEAHPDLCAALYIDAPVLNILSMAGLGMLKQETVDVCWKDIASTFGVNKSTIVNFRQSPIDNMEPLIKNNIPIIMLYGEIDDVVIYEENGKTLEEYYRKHNGNLKVIVRSNCGHHPHGIDDPSVIVEFVEKYGFSVSNSEECDIV